MFWIYFWIYTFFLAIIAGFFVVIRIHALKFQNFQTVIIKIIRIICITLISLAFIWYVIIFSISSSFNTWEIKSLKDIDKDNFNQKANDIEVNYY